MKKFVSVLFVLLFGIVLSTGLVLAEDSHGTNRPVKTDLNEEHRPQGSVKPIFKNENAQFRDKSQNEQGELGKKPEELEKHDGSRSAEFKQKATEELKKNFGKLDVHLLAYLNRLNKIADKINSRIGKLKSKEIDTSAAEAKMADAKVLCDAAKVAIDKAKADIGTISGTGATKESVAGTRQSVEAAKKALISCHKGLSDAVRVLARLNGSREGSRSAREGTGGADEK